MIPLLFKKIVVAVNGSDYSMGAARYAIIMAKQYKCQVKAVYVVDTATIRQLVMTKLFVKGEAERIERSLVADGEKYLDIIREEAASKSVKIETELRKGAVWSELVSAADESKASLILLGSHAESRGSVRRLSAANSEIIGSAGCSVMVVREPQIDQLFKLA